MKKLIKNLPVAAFIIAFGLGLSSFAFLEDTVWVYEDNGEQTTMPNCTEIPPDVCAKEYFLNPDGSLGQETGKVEYGDRI